MNLDGASGSQLIQMPPSGSLTVGVVPPREMRYFWTRLRIHTKGLKVMSDGVKDVTGDLAPFLHRALGDLATRFLCSITAFCGRLDDLSLICTLLDLTLFLYLYPVSTFWRSLHFRSSETEDLFLPICSVLPLDAEKL
jgi:hypothetical protein